jgi:hypothetical protein
MNITQLVTPELRACLNAVPTKEWEIFFERLRQQLTSSLASIPKEDLTDLQAKVKLLVDLEHSFKTLREQTNQR